MPNPPNGRTASHAPTRTNLVETVPFGLLRETAPIDRFRLDNGLTVLVHEDHQAPVFAYHTWFKVGSRHEVPGRTGMAHLFEHLMFKETKTLGAGEFDRIMERNGGTTNAATWVDWTYYHEKLPASKLELAVRLEADRMGNMILGPHQLESEREVVMNERRLRVDNDPDGRAYESLYSTAFGAEHPYGWPTIGWMEDIRAIGLDDCLAFYETYYSPNNATVVVVGDVDTRHVMELVAQHYGAYEAQPTPADEPNPPSRQDAQRYVELALPLSSDRLVLGYHAPSILDPDVFGVEVLAETLCNSDSARLQKRLLYDDELASHAAAWVAGFRYPGLFHLDVHLKPGASAERALAVVDEEIARICAEPPGEMELERARVKVEVQLVRNLLSVDSKAHLLGLYETTAGDFKKVLTSMDELRAVTAADVSRVARRVLREDRRTVLMARPEVGE